MRTRRAAGDGAREPAAARRRRRWRLAVAIGLAVAGVAGIAVVQRLTAREEPAPRLLACQPGPTVKGIDVSYFQEEIAWRQVRRSGVQFAFIRISDGPAIVDPKFAVNWLGARRVGVLRGAYQYFRPEESALAQADLLIAALRRDPGELPPALDVETAGGQSPQQLAARITAWIERVRGQLRVEPIVYTGPEFWRDRAGGADLSSQELWIAHYTTGCPAVPSPWTRWTFWQHTDRGSVPGIEGAVDLNVFSGDYLALEELGRRARLAVDDQAAAAAAAAPPSASR